GRTGARRRGARDGRRRARGEPARGRPPVAVLATGGQRRRARSENSRPAARRAWCHTPRAPARDRFRPRRDRRAGPGVRRGALALVRGVLEVLGVVVVEVFEGLVGHLVDVVELLGLVVAVVLAVVVLVVGDVERKCLVVRAPERFGVDVEGVGE